eukprot:3949156-Alexandrium_andersonii.AAC.1
MRTCNLLAFWPTFTNHLSKVYICMHVQTPIHLRAGIASQKEDKRRRSSLSCHRPGESRHNPGIKCDIRSPYLRDPSA